MNLDFTWLTRYLIGVYGIQRIGCVAAHWVNGEPIGEAQMAAGVNMIARMALLPPAQPPWPSDGAEHELAGAIRYRPDPA